MFGEMRTAALLAKARGRRCLRARCRQRAARGDARRRAARWASSDASARSKPASRPTWSASTWPQLETQPLHHVVSQLVYATGRHQVSDVWIAGQRKLRERVLVDMDVDGDRRQRAPVARPHRRGAHGVTAEPDDARQRDDNFRQAELDKFGALAHRWWDPDGPQKALHALNPGAPGLRRRARAAARRARARRRLRRRPAQRGDGARGRAGHRARPRAGAGRRSRGCTAWNRGVQVDYRLQSVEALADETAGAVRRDHLHGNARARARSGRGLARLRDAAQARRPPVPVDAQPHAGRVRAGDRRRRIHRAACCPRARTSTATSSSRRNWRPGCATPGCELEDVSGLVYEPLAQRRARRRAAPTSTTSPARAKPA